MDSCYTAAMHLVVVDNQAFSLPFYHDHLFITFPAKAQVFFYCMHIAYILQPLLQSESLIHAFLMTRLITRISISSISTII